MIRQTFGAAMLTDRQIEELLIEPKLIISKRPANGYVEEFSQKRCDLDLVSEGGGEHSFAVFVRQHLVFIENFSIGLRFQTGTASMGFITLPRYNGPHGEYSLSPDGHFASAHIHRLTEAELAAGSSQPQEKLRQMTNSYGTFDEALRTFFQDIRVTSQADYFPEFLQGRLFDGDR